MQDIDISLADIIQARDKIAAVVMEYGEQYLPIFERLEHEVEKRKKQEALLKKAARIYHKNSTQNGTHFGTQNKL